MIRRTVFVVAILGLVAFLAPSAQAHPGSMTGAWGGTDIFDGSTLHVTIGGGKNRVVYQDDGATVCLTNFGEFSKASGKGFGDRSGDHLEVTMDINCHLSGGLTLWMADLLLTFDHDPATGTLTDQSGQCYHRPNSPSDCATPD